FGTNATLQTMFPALIKDMIENSQSVDSSTVTIGIPDYNTENTETGVVSVGTLLDGITSPIAGAQAISQYNGVTTQLTPDSETLTLTCTSDSENGSQRGG